MDAGEPEKAVGDSEAAEFASGFKIAVLLDDASDIMNQCIH